MLLIFITPIQHKTEMYTFKQAEINKEINLNCYKPEYCA